jgi:hypothetical protein
VTHEFLKEPARLARRAVMTTRRALIALVALGLSLSGCATRRSLGTSSTSVTEACAPTGSVPTATVSDGTTTRIASEGMVDVEVTVGAAPSVNISCAPELLPHIHVESRGDLLRIWTDSDFDIDVPSEEHCVVLVGSPRLLSYEASGTGDGRIHSRAEEMERVTMSGSGDVEIDELAAPAVRIETSGSGDVIARGLHAQTLAIKTNGSGDVRVDGTSERVQIACSGSGDVDARGLGAQAIEASTSGSGDIEIAASQRAEVNTSGSGDVVVRGRPAQRSANSNGSGSISFK